VLLGRVALKVVKLQTAVRVFPHGFPGAHAHRLQKPVSGELPVQEWLRRLRLTS
jgi:hypothetical protein